MRPDLKLELRGAESTAPATAQQLRVGVHEPRFVETDGEARLVGDSQ